MALLHVGDALLLALMTLAHSLISVRDVASVASSLLSLDALVLDPSCAAVAALAVALGVIALLFLRLLMMPLVSCGPSRNTEQDV